MVQIIRFADRNVEFPTGWSVMLWGKVTQPPLTRIERGRVTSSIVQECVTLCGAFVGVLI
jgi:hypothetical protein